MPLTVRLDKTLEHALERYCAENGVNKSLVVQESLGQYLVQRQADKDLSKVQKASSPALRAFEAAGLLGTVDGEGKATKDRVRAAVRASALTRAKR